jgi:hypothetical protein
LRHLVPTRLDDGRRDELGLDVRLAEFLLLVAIHQGNPKLNGAWLVCAIGALLGFEFYPVSAIPT